MPSYNLVELAQAVADELGRPELVVNYATADYTPTTRFLRIINAAGRRLDRRVDYNAEYRRWQGNLVAGQYLLDIPKEIQYIDEIDIETATERIKLEMRDENWMRRTYGEPFSTVENAQPLDWSRWTPIGLYGESAIKNGTFGTTVAEWTVNTGTFTWVAGKGRLQSTAASASVDYIFPAAQDLLGSTFSFDVVTMSDPTDLYYVEFHTGATSYTIFPLSTDGEFVIDDIIRYYVDEGGDLDTLRDDFRAITKIRFVVVASNGDYMDLDNVRLVLLQSSQGNVMVMPPADQTYTVNVKARVWGTDFVQNTDKTYWGNRHPDILITAIKRQIAEELSRNRTEVEEYDAVLNEQLFELERDMGMEEQGGDRGSNRMGYMQ